MRRLPSPPDETIAAEIALPLSIFKGTSQGHYDQLWAQNAAAMYAYANASVAASTMTPFTSPPAADADEVISAGAELVSMLPAALCGLSSASSCRFRTAVLSMSSPLSKLSSLRTGFAREASIPIAVAIGGAAAKAGRGHRAAVTAGLARGISIGGLSAPPAWLADGQAACERTPDFDRSHSSLGLSAKPRVVSSGHCESRRHP
ncbi:hypothetical protein [Mycobacterium nebraskense]|uniref:hypothetical protein n=1 Tax=Mycobacterium nebraskense TaxID=244292 RepID=UPI000B33754F|nr:hypothetical protein [Mycobacterium nebraskense]